MSKKVSVDNLAKEISKTLVEYIGVTEAAATSGVDETAKKALSQLRNAHPAGSEEYGSWNEYNRGWTVKKTKRDKTATIHNKDHYQLTHLLEKGHAKVNGGRTRALQHIAPVADMCDTELLNNIRRQIERG